MANEPNNKESPHTVSGDRSLERIAWIDSVCDAYEKACQEGGPPPLSDFLRQSGLDPDSAPADLLAQLAPLAKAYGHDQPTTAAPGAPRRVGRYELRRLLGSGGFGEVYAAFDPQLHRVVALKLPHKGLVGDSAAENRFYREARAAARLKHPNIVPVHDAGADGSVHFIASEFVEGQTLREACPVGGMEFERAARVVADLAEAVAYAHRAGVVHRDIKPGNVLLDAADNPHLTDFGLAAFADGGDRVTSDGEVLGTPAYMAPEQAAGRFGPAMPASDQYSLGAVLYNLLTGRPLFQGPPQVVIHHVLNTTPQRPSVLRQDVPAELERICRKALAFRPDHRYPDCASLAADLRRWLEPDAKKRQRRRWYRDWKTVAGLATVLLLLGAVAHRWVNRTDSASEGNADQAEEGPHAKAIAAARPDQVTDPILFRLSPPPQGADYLEATWCLPIEPQEPRRILDFDEIHGATPRQLEAWLERLERLTPDYFTVTLGEHATADPPQFHAIAVRLNRRVLTRFILRARENGRVDG